MTPSLKSPIATSEKKRSTRPSFSTGNSPKPYVDQASASESKTRRLNYWPFFGSSTNAVNFEDFSFIGPDRRFSLANVSSDHMNILYAYLVDTYDVNLIQFSESFIVLECGHKMPPIEQRPFTIAGLMTIWQSSDDRVEFMPLIGEAEEGDLIKIPPSILAKMEALKLPPDDVIVYLAENAFSDCIGISVMASFMIVELPTRSNEDFFQHFRTLPSGIEGAPYALRFHNGQLPNTPSRSRAVTPLPQKLGSLVADETDYVARDGRFYPGSMLNSLTANGEVYGSGTAGILVEKRNERRLTCSWHSWEAIDNEHPGLFGQTTNEARDVFRVAQGLTGDETNPRPELQSHF